MKTKIEAIAMWELGVISVYLEGVDEEGECTFFVPSRPVSHERSNPGRCTFEHGFATHGSIDLTVEQAESLAQKLLDAVQDMRRMDRDRDEYFERRLL